MSKLVQKILLLLLITSIFLAPALALPDVTNPRPTIWINYSAEDKPVTIHEATVTYPSGYNISLTAQAAQEIDPYEFSFQVTSYLFPGVYKLYIDSSDADGNHIYIDDSKDNEFEVLLPPSQIWIEEPAIPYFAPETQNIGIAATLPKVLKIKTKFPASCRLLTYVEGSTINESQLYYSNAASYFNNNPDYIGNDHYIQIKDTTVANPQYELPVSGEFNYAYPDDDAYLIVCKQESEVGEEVIYSMQKVHLGYDPTSPEYEIIFDPTIIVDESEVFTTMNIDTTGDLVICDYDYPINPLPGQDDDEGELPEFSTITDIFSFQQTHEHVFDFPGKPFELYQDYTFRVETNCKNPAMSSTIKTNDYVVSLTRELEVTLEKTSYTTNKPTLNFTSTLNAYCEYTFEEETDFIDGTNFAKEHLLTLSNLEDGEHTIELHCEGQSIGVEYDQTYTFIIDTTAPPQPLLDGTTTSCGNAAIQLQIQPQTEEDVRYNISLKLGNEYVIPGILYPTSYTNEVVEYNLPTDLLIENEIYTWEVYAQDLYGQESQKTTHQVEITQYEGPICDITPPTSSIYANVTMQGYEVYIFCQDEETGCANTFTYQEIEVNQDCNFPLSQTEEYTNLPLLFSENKKLCYTVSDNAGNEEDKEVIITASFTIALEEPKFGVANTKDFNLQIITNRQAHCKHGYLGAAHPESLADWYAILNDFSNTDATTHTTQIQANNYLQLNENLDKSYTDWIVICNELGSYQYLEITPFGFDTTPPEIIIQATPNPVVDPGNLKTTLTVQTTDLSVCTFEGDEGINYFEPYDLDNYYSYKKEHETEIAYWGIKEPYTEIQTITCRNIAQTNNQNQYEIRITPEDKVNITILNEEYTQERTITLQVETKQLADCAYNINNEYETFQGLQTTGEYIHEQPITLAEGVQRIEVYCKALGTGDEGIVTKDIILDTQKPELTILTNQGTCSLEAMTFSIQSSDEGSGIHYFEYSITGEGIDTINKTSQNSEIYEELDLEEGKSYTILVRAYDMAGNTQTATKQVQASTFDPIICDMQAPTANVEVRAAWGGYKATIICDDDIACTDTFTYQLTKGNCSLTSQQSKQYTDQPLSINTTTTLCYTVYDMAGHKTEGSKRFKVQEECYNYEEDLTEEGTDCGGVCLPACGTCENKEWDLFELGVDCGGVCQNIRECSEDEYVCQNETECDLVDDLIELPDNFSKIIEDPIVIIPNGSLLINGTELYDALYYPNGTIELENGSLIGPEDYVELPNGDKLYPDGTIESDEPVDDRECVTNADCDLGYICNYQYECVYDDEPNKPTYEEEQGMNIWGLILIILGLLLMGGGGYYIYDSRTRKAQEQQEQQQAQQMQNQEQQQALQRQRQEQEKQRLEELKKKHLAQQENLAAHQQERKEKRKSILGVFNVDGEEQVNTTEEQEKNSQTNTAEEEETKPKTPKEPAKLDEGLEGEFVDIRKLHSNALNDLEKLKNKQDKEREEEQETIKSEKEITPQDEPAQGQAQHNDERKNIFSELKSLTAKEQISTISKEQQEKNNKEQVDENEKKKLEDITSKTEQTTTNTTPSSKEKIDVSNPFSKLQEMVAHNTHQEPIEKQTQPREQKQLTSEELMKIFTKDVNKFDEQTLISVLTILIEEEKIDLASTRNLLEKLADKGLIKKENITALFAKLVN